MRGNRLKAGSPSLLQLVTGSLETNDLLVNFSDELIFKLQPSLVTGRFLF